jgi:GT2 family glycosyltransferase
LNDSTYLTRAIQALEHFPDLSGLSARGVVPFDHPRRIPHRNSRTRQLINLPSKFFPKVFSIRFLGPFGSKYSFFGDVSTPPYTRLWFSKKALRYVFVGESVVRGPILWRTSHLKLCNGFNDVGYFLGWDDYDLCYRLFNEYNLRTGYLASSAYSLINTGTNSFLRSSQTQIEYERREYLATLHQGSISEYWNLREFHHLELESNWERRKF